MMNEKPNNFRRVPYAEYEANHMFKVMRHFPELAKTIPEVHEIQVKAGRNWQDQFKSKVEKPRELKFRSTRRLDSLKKSAVGMEGVGGQMDEMRKVLLISRNPNMANQLKKSGNMLENGPDDGMTGGFSLSSPGNGSVGLLEDNMQRGPESMSRASTRKGPRETRTHLELANEKLEKSSLSHAPTSQVNNLIGFQGQDLTMDEFDVQLRRCMQIVLTRKELIAMFSSMDADGSGLIDGVEFTRYFLTMGVIAREKIQMEAVERMQRETIRMARHKIDEENKVKLWEQSQISEDTTQQDEERIFARLGKVALHWDGNSHINELKLNGFDCYLTPFAFKKQIEASFGIVMSNIDIGALMKRYKTRAGEFCVDGKAFLQSFNKLRRETKVQHRKVLSILADRKKKISNISKRLAETSYSALGR